MQFMIRTFYAKNVGALRQQVLPLHAEYLEQRASMLLAAGALLHDDGSVGEGGLFLIDAESKAQAEALITEDPFFKRGVVVGYEVSRWRQGFYNRTKHIAAPVLATPP